MPENFETFLRIWVAENISSLGSQTDATNLKYILRVRADELEKAATIKGFYGELVEAVRPYGGIEGYVQHQFEKANEVRNILLCRLNERQSMKAFVTSICALALSSAAIAQNISAEDFDLACAVTAGAIFGSNPKAERDASKTVWTFYLGRLTGRDDKTIWNTVIKGRIAEMGEKAKSEEFYGKCIDFYTVKTTE